MFTGQRGQGRRGLRSVRALGGQIVQPGNSLWHQLRQIRENPGNTLKYISQVGLISLRVNSQRLLNYSQSL